MNISLQEAMALLDQWKNSNTVLQLSLNRSGKNRKLDAKVVEVKETGVVLSSGEEQIQVDLAAAEFNGDPKGRQNSTFGPYLVCEYRNGDTCSLYAPRTNRSEP